MSTGTMTPRSVTAGSTTPMSASSRNPLGFTPASSISSDNPVYDDFDAVAIVGMACRTAGGNKTPEQLWQFLMDKKDASGESPAWRWEPWIKRDSRNAKIISKTINKGYFIEDVEKFDAAFFGISPKEAEQMDPHQRLGLEVTWQALEDAGIDPKSLAGSDTAVYMGVDSDDYSRLLLEDLPNIEAWMGIGTTAHGIPNRISYHLDLMGPSSAVDAACASSLVAVHAGAHAIKSGESRVAIVGGVNVCLSPALFHMLGAAGALSPDGVCESFDDAAHGYARGEGAAVLVLKRLSHAIADNDHVHALLRGVAVAQDGKTNGIMAPNANAQEIVARKALGQSDIDPLSVGYIEAHATSTSLGDPVEVSAISKVYGTGRPADAPAIVGSIKPNVGHLEAAAGAIGMVKAIMAVEKGCIPPQTRLNKLNTRVDWELSGLQVPRLPIKWAQDIGPRRAAICSYGYGGTVSHAVIEQSPVTFNAKQQPHLGPTLMVISATQEKRLTAQASAQGEWILADGQSEGLGLIASTLAQRRAQHDFRAAFVVESHREAAERLQSFSTGTANADWIASGRVFPNSVSKDTVWVFSGHGAQWPEMAKELLQKSVFTDTIAPLVEIVSRELGWSAWDALQAGTLEDGPQAQVLTYLMQIGLTEVLKSKGIQPQAIIGHSVGEIAASVAAGAISPVEGALIVTRRARCYAQVKNTGGMYLVNLPFAKVAGELGNRKDIVPAIASSPSSCVVSGATQALVEYVDQLKSRGRRALKVNSDIPFHSPLLNELVQPLHKALSGELNPRAPSIKLYSTSNLDPRTNVPRDVHYWTTNMTQPVWLTSAVNAAAADGYRTFLEVSTHPIVSQSVNEILEEAHVEEYVVVPTMKKKQPVERSLFHSIAQLYVKGAKVEFSTMLGPQWSKKVPGFQWSQKPYWKQVSSGQATSTAARDVDTHTMLGDRCVVAGSETALFTTQMEEHTKPFPRPHELHGVNIIPAAVYINTFYHATGAGILSELTIRLPLAITDQVRDVQVIVQKETVKVASRLSSGDDNSWMIHADARWTREAHIEAPMLVDVESVKRRIGTLLPSTFSIDYLAKVGVAGIAFPWSVSEHYGNEKEMIAKVDNDANNASITWDPRSWAPTLDAASSIGSTVFADNKLRIVSKIDQLQVFSAEPAPKVFYVFATETDAAAEDSQTRSAEVSVLSEAGELLAKFTGIRLSEVDTSSKRDSSINGLVHQLAWVPARMAEHAMSPDAVVLISDNEAKLDQYQTELKFQISSVESLTAASSLEGSATGERLRHAKKSAVVLVPGQVGPIADVATATQRFIWEVATAVKFIVDNKLSSRLFIICDGVFAAKSTTALGQGPLYGLARVIASEHSDIWGGLIDNGSDHFPFLPFKYVQGEDIVRYIDGVPRIARMRPFSKDQRLPSTTKKTLLPKPEGTYVITGGLGALGLATCNFLVEKGARRILIFSRRALPPRKSWGDANAAMSAILSRIRHLEELGATVYVEPVDVGALDAHEQIIDTLDRLALPDVLGVIHASGVLEDGLLVNTTADSFKRVLAPKISGALALHRAFPPGSLDFFVMYSSIGQLVGTSGQSSYGAGNAFLDVLAACRRNEGDNAIAFQFTAWHGLGMGASTDFLTLELESKGITDISADEGFRAWQHLSNYDTDYAVVTRVRAFEEGELLPISLIDEVAPRKQASRESASTTAGSQDTSSPPTSTPDLKEWLSVKIRELIGSVMKIDDIEEIDPRAAIMDIGVDSVMTIPLRAKLQSAMKIRIPQTFMWNYPTVESMVEWFTEQLQSKS